MRNRDNIAQRLGTNTLLSRQLAASDQSLPVATMRHLQQRNLSRCNHEPTKNCSPIEGLTDGIPTILALSRDGILFV